MPAADPLVPFSRVAKFVRQLMHDFRNGLNAIDLESSLIAELATDPELSAEAVKLRSMVNNTAKSLQQLSPYLGDVVVNRISFPSKECIDDVRVRIGKYFGSQADLLEWEIESLAGDLNVDYELFNQAMVEVLENAFAFADAGTKIRVTTGVDNSGAWVDVTQKLIAEPATSVEDWGREPFLSTRRGKYGLGLFYARRIVEAHGGELTISYKKEDGSLRTRLNFPANS